MSDFSAQHVIEAFRSGVPSRAVGAYFSKARPEITGQIAQRLEAVRETGRSDGMLFTGRYGEGKTHLLNTVFSLAAAANMVVSWVSLGKETPLSKPYLLYEKLMANTYLPGARQPGFRGKLEELTANSGAANDLLDFAARGLETDRLYFLLKAFFETQEEDERALFLADLEGSFTTGAAIKRSYRRIFGTPAKFKENFSKRKHGMDYFCFMSRLFRQLGYGGWVLLFDEAELIGRLGKQARMRSYREMQAFLNPSPRLEGAFSLFALSSSYAGDVIEQKGEFTNASTAFAGDPEALKAANATLTAILAAPELAPLTREEILGVLTSIRDFHGRAYGWQPQADPEEIYKATEAGGYLLRTKIRAAIEYLDQLFQYGEAGNIRVGELGKETFDEEDAPEEPEEP